MIITTENRPATHDISTPEDTANLEAFIDSLQDQPMGEGFNLKDYYLLAIIGIVIPAILLMWGIS